LSAVQSLPTPAEAEALVRRHVEPLPIESRPLAALAGAVLAQSVRAERDQPPFDRVTMDGIAIASEAWRGGAAALSHRRHAGGRPAAAVIAWRDVPRGDDRRGAAAGQRLRHPRRAPGGGGRLG
jgi:molybdopterin biosynthesis enzyme